jgi:hypothetical protein
MEAAAKPLPSEESTPPVTKMNLVRVDFVGCMAITIATWQLIGQEIFSSKKTVVKLPIIYETSHPKYTCFLSRNLVRVVCCQHKKSLTYPISKLKVAAVAFA